jgi:hypothetical protein
VIRPAVRRLGLVLVAVLALGCPPLRAQGPAQAPAAEGVVFTVDGSGSLREIGDDLRLLVDEAHLPLQVEAFDWSQGRYRVFADLHGHDHQKAKGEELAALVLARRQACPAGKVYLVSHSSGAAIVLAAAQQLPPGCVDRVILLAPALSPNCDLTPVLRCSRLGVDSFHSDNDLVSRVLTVVGNADGHFCVAAGCAGFRFSTEASADPGLYANLHQHPWDWEMRKVGHYGGHFGCTRSGFMRTYLLPLLDGTRTRTHF